MMRTQLLGIISQLHDLLDQIPDRTGSIPKVKRARRSRTRDKRLSLPLRDIAETGKVIQAFKAIQDSGVFPVQTWQILNAIDIYTHSSDERALVRHILTNAGYEYVSVRAESGTVKTWRAKTMDRL